MLLLSKLVAFSIAQLEKWVKVATGLRRGISNQPLEEFRTNSNHLVYRIQNATISPRDGYVFDANGRLVIQTSQWGWPDSLIRSPHPLRPRALEQLSENYVFLSSTSYYHWLLEDLPSFLAAREAFPNAKVLCELPISSYARDLLDLLGIKEITTLKHQASVTSLFAGEKGRAVLPNAVSISTLRNNLLRSPGTTAPHRKVFVTREAQKDRTPENLILLENLFFQHGFEILNLETFSLPEQIQVIRESRVLAGIHGAGLANQVWMQSGGHVLELKRSDQPGCFMTLAEILSLDYVPVSSPQSQPWIVDLQELQILIDSQLH